MRLTQTIAPVPPDVQERMKTGLREVMYANGWKVVPRHARVNAYRTAEDSRDVFTVQGESGLTTGWIRLYDTLDGSIYVATFRPQNKLAKAYRAVN